MGWVSCIATPVPTAGAALRVTPRGPYGSETTMRLLNRRVLAVAALGGIAIVAFVLAYFEPQKLFIDDRVNEPLPTVAASDAEGAGGPGAKTKPRIEAIASGNFQSYEHSTSGR